jgi:hypothetical protein
MKDAQDPTPMFQGCTVTGVECLSMSRSTPPRFRAYNEEVYGFDRSKSSFPRVGGVFVSESSGAVVAMWACYSYASAKGEHEVCVNLCESV